MASNSAPMYTHATPLLYGDCESFKETGVSVQGITRALQPLLPKQLGIFTDCFHPPKMTCHVLAHPTENAF